MDTQLHASEASGFIPPDRYAMRSLTARDRDVIALVLAGHTNAEIARRLNLQLQTLKNTLSAIYDKVGVSTRLQLAVLLLREGGTAGAGAIGPDGTPPAAVRL